MLQGNNIVLLIGVALGVALLLLGVWLGRRSSVSYAQANEEELGLDQDDRERVLRLLQELGAWTSEYSGNVSDYQHMLGQLSQEVRAGADRENSSDNRVVVLLQQIMQSNEKLQTRLDAAERQLEKQTQQIQSYLTEARTDGLTGLANRRAFDQQLEDLFSGYRNGGRSFVVALIDIDRFKSINDNHGHQAGDHVLQQVAALLRSKIEDVIMVARVGGEEFAIITDGPLRVASQKMNQLRKQISEQQVEVGNTLLDVTVSVGVSEPRDDMVVAPVLRRADESLYAAKNMGRNRVYFHDGRGPTLLGAPEIVRSSPTA
ncbi:MAG: GGDEF domain-containing protein [Rubripirellula sp.]